MFNNSNGFTMPVVPANYGTSNSGFGGFGSDWIGLIVILAILGWGGNGFGFGGGFGGGRGCVEPCATKADLTAQGIVQKLDGITYGISDATFALSNSINNGFHGVDSAICNLGYQTQSGFNGLSAQLAQCCCDNRAAISEVRYDMATQACDTRNLIQSTTRDIIDGQNASTRAILDFMVQSKMDEKDSKISQLETELMLSRQNAYFTANQDAQTAELIRRMGKDCPVNAYVVQPPAPVTFPVNACGQFSGYGYGGSCGCGCA